MPTRRCEIEPVHQRRRPTAPRRRGRRAAAAALLGASLLLHACGPAGEPALSVSEAQAAVPLAGSSQLVLAITNRGDGEDRLVAVDTDAAVGVELHETRIEDGIATMVSLDEIVLPAGETVRFRPGGLHLMMLGPDDDVALGARFPLTLRFDRSDPITVTAEVRDLLDLAEESFDADAGDP
ncbi:MAG: copper chaperone PCu(A)C [Nitriliruptoraceae bacterium]